MTEITLKLIAKNEAKFACGRDGRGLDLGNYEQTEVSKE